MRRTRQWCYLLLQIWKPSLQVDNLANPFILCLVDISDESINRHRTIKNIVSFFLHIANFFGFLFGRFDIIVFIGCHTAANDAEIYRVHPNLFSQAFYDMLNSLLRAIFVHWTDLRSPNLWFLSYNFILAPIDKFSLQTVTLRPMRLENLSRHATIAARVRKVLA